MMLLPMMDIVMMGIVIVSTIMHKMSIVTSMSIQVHRSKINLVCMIL